MFGTIKKIKKLKIKLYALVYDIPPPTTAASDYAIGLETIKLSANGQFFVDAQNNGSKFVSQLELYLAVLS